MASLLKKVILHKYILKILHIISGGPVYLMACYRPYWKSMNSRLKTWTLYTPDVKHLHNMFYATKNLFAQNKR